MKYRTLFSVVVIGLLLSFSGCKEKVAQKSTAKKVALTKKVLLVSPKKITRAVSISEGVTLKPEEQGVVAADISAPLIKWYVHENQRVKKGQPIALQDDTDYLLALSEAEAKIAALESQVSAVEKTYERMQILKEKGSVTEQQFDEIEAQYKALSKQLEAGNTGIKMLKRRIAKAVIRAPYSGIITKKILPLGYHIIVMMPSSGDIAYIEKSDRLKLELNLSEHLYNEIEEKQTISLFIPSLNKHLEAKITHKGKSINPMKQFSIVSFINNKKGEIPGGVYAIARITGKEIERTLVPPLALRRGKNGLSEIFTVVAGHITTIPVASGQ
ncbi:efflux RND transporter periplasmic adaptor subunit, partial [bacterium]|nr:efflux RND transporter periplasmic adaptor subunit [bacterium]